MKIAVGIDFSEQAAQARAVATVLCGRFGASLAVIHVVEPYPTEPQEEALAEEARNKLRPIVEELRASGLEVEAEVTRGYPEEEIAAAALRLDAQLLVLGTQGRRAPLRWILGSVAERTLQASEVPVLVVGDASGLVEWGNGTRPLRVTVGIESADPAPTILATAKWLQSAGACELTFVHVAARSLLAGRLAALLERTIRTRLGDLKGRIELVANGESLSASLAGFVTQHPSDLLLVGIHPRFELDVPRSAEVARALLRRRVGPVLGVPVPRPPIGAGIPAFRSVLAATDLSELGNRAVAHAYSIAHGAPVTVLHVHPLQRAMPLDDERRAELELQVLALVPGEATRATTNVVIVESDRPAQAIVDTATRLGCDVLCMGSHGRSAVGRAVLGSVAEEVTHRFPRAVLLVR
jgi:nucleotide-binding universal stress UspA family protein